MGLMPLRPFRLHPVYKEKPWGGDKLNRFFGRSLPSPLTGESWELSTHPHGISTVADGPYAGLTFPEALSRDPLAMLGERDAQAGRFPLLIKFLDVNDLLSVQVHPGDSYASAHGQGDSGKTEAWYVLDAGEDACLYLGLKPGVDRASFREGIEKGTLADLMRRVPVSRGDVVFIPAGTVHTASGLLLCEVQQNSDATYRVYDWGRVAPDGSTRPLHIEQALDVTDFSGRETGAVPGLSHRGEGWTRTLYIACHHFALEEVRCAGLYRDDTASRRFHVLSLVEGSCLLRWRDEEIPVSAGQTIFVPASAGNYAMEGDGVWIKAYRPTAMEAADLLREWGREGEVHRVAGLAAYLEET